MLATRRGSVDQIAVGRSVRYGRPRSSSRRFGSVATTSRSSVRVAPDSHLSSSRISTAESETCGMRLSGCWRSGIATHPHLRSASHVCVATAAGGCADHVRQCSARSSRRVNHAPRLRALPPQRIAARGGSARHAATNCNPRATRRGQPIKRETISPLWRVVSLSFTSWNRIAGWLQRIEALRVAA